MAKVMITIPDDFLKEIDAVAKAEHRTRSELFREAVRKYTMETHQPNRVNTAEVFRRLQNANIPWYPGTAEDFVREMRDKDTKITSETRNSKESK